MIKIPTVSWKDEISIWNHFWDLILIWRVLFLLPATSFAQSGNVREVTNYGLSNDVITLIISFSRCRFLFSEFWRVRWTFITSIIPRIKDDESRIGFLDEDLLKSKYVRMDKSTSSSSTRWKERGEVLCKECGPGSGNEQMGWRWRWSQSFVPLPLQLESRSRRKSWIWVECGEAEWGRRRKKEGRRHERMNEWIVMTQHWLDPSLMILTFGYAAWTFPSSPAIITVVINSTKEFVVIATTPGIQNIFRHFVSWATSKSLPPFIIGVSSPYNKRLQQMEGHRQIWSPFSNLHPDFKIIVWSFCSPSPQD